MSGVSFTVRRPTPISNDSSDVEPNAFKVPAVPSRLRDNQNSRSGSPLNPNGKRPLNFNDSDDEEDTVTEELVVGFDAMGAQRANGSLGQREQLVIPSLPNKDWRAAARKKKGYLPDEGKMTVGLDGSQGGLGTKEIINSGPQQSGLIIFKKRKIDDDDYDSAGEGLKNEVTEESELPSAPEPELTDEQRAVNALIAASKQTGNGDAEEMLIDAIPVASSENWRVQSETEAYREDVATRPDSSSAEDYKRVPVSQFGTALLLGMGWKPGQGVSKSGNGPTEAFVPKARPALLGLGAKPSEVVDSSNQRGGSKPSKRYIPLVAKERPQGDDKGSRNEDSRRTSERQDRPHDTDTRERRDRDYERDRSPDSRDRRNRSRDRRDERDSSRSHKERDDRHRDRHRDSGRDRGSDYRRRDQDDERYSSRDEKYRERRDDRRDDKKRR